MKTTLKIIGYVMFFWSLLSLVSGWSIRFEHGPIHPDFMWLLTITLFSGIMLLVGVLIAEALASKRDE